ncbi:DUF1206 domain-containing protein [Roseibacterium sp. SDUM158017]|uniref:DUF1206 domain-containing protein n=1 Tax=Roseicyclus salinarum TaxID=3036773 RepID=UPI002414DFE6|nr:DUF1206 domain-containing protein [Roseibacterium sp. SDUM158017]MDG4647661.1 DUF1206 domain-containing protein [Roseibacterium sp. SDUM158017]
MAERSLNWVMPIMRAGYAARGLVYVVVGGVAVWSAWLGGSGQGTTGALSTLRNEPFGQTLLWVMAAGLWAYMIWRFLDAALDLEDYGADGKGLVSRAGLVATGVIHGAIGVSVASLAMGGNASGGGGGGSGTQGFVSQVMQMPGGRWIVGAIGLGVIGAGIYYAYKGFAEKYKEDIVNTSATERLEPVLKFGLIAEGVVVGIVGVLIAYAAFTLDPSEAGGVGAAFEQIRAAPFGRILLIVIALGLIGFGIENFIEAIYRVVPKLRDPDTQTMAMHARAEAERAKRKAEGKARRAVS